MCSQQVIKMSTFLTTKEEILFSTSTQRMTPQDALLKATTLLGSMTLSLRIIQLSMASRETRLHPMKNSSTNLITRSI